MSTKLENYRVHCNDTFAKGLAQMLMCTCAECSVIPPKDRSDILAQSLVDVLALHLFAKSKANVDLGQDTMVEARNKARNLLDRLFTEFGMDRDQTPETGGPPK